jgi:hypothetical protein
VQGVVPAPRGLKRAAKRNTWAHQERSSGSGLFRIIAESYQVGTVKLLPANGEHFWAGDTTFAGAISWEISP